MSLDRRNLEFIARRKRRLAWWPAAAGLLVVLLVALVAWLFIRHPLLIDPTELPRQLQGGSLADSTVALMAGMLPLAVGLCVLAVAVTLLFAGIAFHREQRLIALIEDLHERTGDDSSAGSKGTSDSFIEP